MSLPGTPEPPVPSLPRELSRIPTTGMRGGLGRTLLTAFLVLAILPLSTISWYATQCQRRDIQREVIAKLLSAATMMETQVDQWVQNRTANMALLAALPATQNSVTALATSANPTEASTPRDTLNIHLQTLQTQDPAFGRLAVFDTQGQMLDSSDSRAEQSLPRERSTTHPEPGSALPYVTSDSLQNTNDPISLVVTQTISGPDGLPVGLLAGWLDPDGLIQAMHTVNGLGDSGEIYLVHSSGVALPQGRALTSPGITAALSGQDSAGLNENYAGVPVIGVYHWLPELKVALVAEQSQEEAFAPTNAVTAAVVGATLVVALITAVIAAVVTRQITRPIVQLTESALLIAGGRMDQRVPVTSRDEIGILAYVFNRMVAELKTLYDGLEEKVAQRTALLQQANYQIQRRAIQLATTVEVSQAATSILEPDELLGEVVRLIHDRFDYAYVGIYLLNGEDGEAVLKEGTGGGQRLAAVKARPVGIEDGSAVGRAVLTGEPCMVRWDTTRARAVLSSPYIRAEAALPLRMGEQMIGVLDILSINHEDFDADDVSVLQNVSNQITIALENARAYAVEREAAKQLRELDRSKRRFLANMSHELRTPLTNIIGFSRLMLKGIDGRLQERQYGDLEIIYHNGQHLLGLVNDLLDVSQIEAGLVELEFREVDLGDLIHSVMATASALVRDKEIELGQEIAPDVPHVQADGARIRQVLLRLLANAAKFTHEGSITVQCWSTRELVLVSVSDTGVGIAEEDQERIFERFEQGSLENGRRPEGAGLGLALSKEFVEMHGGRMWVESEAGNGSTFTFSLPLRPPTEMAGTEAHDG